MASWLLQNGVSLAHVRDILGHADSRTTERYAHLEAAHLRAAVHALPGKVDTKPDTKKKKPPPK